MQTLTQFKFTTHTLIVTSSYPPTTTFVF